MERKECETGILGAITGDRVRDAKTGRVGTVVMTSQIGNYDIVHVRFRTKGGSTRTVRINAMDDAQMYGRYHFANNERRK